MVKLLAGAGVAIPSGLNPYLPLLVLAIAGVGGKTTLYGPFNFVGSWSAIIILAVLVGVDIFASKFPQLARLYTNINYVLRPLAGAVAFSLVVPTTTLPVVVSLILGLIIALITFYINVSLRQVITTRSKTASVLEPLFSVGEDVLAAMLALLTMGVPVVGGPVSILVLAGMVWWLFSLRRQTGTGKSTFSAQK
ncbi:MAG TPA: DUF4126 domain-containing protein [Chloroflexia bacterium]|nr:DUF4126 domain-containing protein [Chloroflexia bacterium]